MWKSYVNRDARVENLIEVHKTVWRGAKTWGSRVWNLISLCDWGDNRRMGYVCYESWRDLMKCIISAFPLFSLCNSGDSGKREETTTGSRVHWWLTSKVLSLPCEWGKKMMRMVQNGNVSDLHAKWEKELSQKWNSNDYYFPPHIISWSRLWAFSVFSYREGTKISPILIISVSQHFAYIVWTVQKVHNLVIVSLVFIRQHPQFLHWNIVIHALAAHFHRMSHQQVIQAFVMHVFPLFLTSLPNRTRAEDKEVAKDGCTHRWSANSVDGGREIRFSLCLCFPFQVWKWITSLHNKLADDTVSTCLIWC